MLDNTYPTLNQRISGKGWFIITTLECAMAGMLISVSLFII